MASERLPQWKQPLSRWGVSKHARKTIDILCNPCPIFLLTMSLLVLISILKSPFYSEYSYAVSKCASSTLNLPAHRLESRMMPTSYDVCVVIVIGDDSSLPTSTALPFGVVRRIFERVLRLTGTESEVGLTEPDLRGVLVRVDYTSVVCKMVRDALGPSVECHSFQDSRGSQRVQDAPHYVYLRRSMKSQDKEIYKSLYPASCETLVVGQTKKYVQQGCSEWVEKLYYKKLEVVNLDNPNPALQPPILSNWRPTVVTAFSRNHLKHGLLLLRSVGKAASDPIVTKKYKVCLVVWTMEEFNKAESKYVHCVIRELQELGMEAEVRRFPFENYPTWMRLNASLIQFHEGGKGEYAWKAIMAHTVLRERGLILWIDAGGRIVKPLALLQSLDYVKETGFGGQKSEGQVKRWTYPDQLKFFRADYRYLKKQRNCDASRIGFSLKRYADFMRPWYECCITRQCIAPDGSDRSNHRQDQAALTIISYLTGYQCEGLSDDIVRHTDTHQREWYGGVDRTECYQDPINL